jgi:hypothetical protein
MPIVYVHGVNVRSRDGFLEIEPILRRIVAPAISNDSANVLIDDVYWGDLAANLAWNGASRPLSQLLAQAAQGRPPTGAEGAFTAATFREILSRVPSAEVKGPSTGGLTSGITRPSGGIGTVRIVDLKDDEISDLLAQVISEVITSSEKRAPLMLVADEAVRDPIVRASLRGAATRDQELAVLFNEVSKRIRAETKLFGMGGLVEMGRKGGTLDNIRDRLRETLERALGAPSYAVSVVSAEIRKPLNEFLSGFFGDVFAYLDKRGVAAAPGPIQKKLLTTLKRAHSEKRARNGEPLVVLTHSMGSQIVYDAITHFLPTDPSNSDLRIDFWCASASQVGFFEELGLFRGSDHQTYGAGTPVPFPKKHLGIWWNVWDHNDFLSYTTKTIIEKVDDESFDSGMSLLQAHGGYLKRPSFFRKFAEKLREAAVKDWRTP